MLNAVHLKNLSIHLDENGRKVIATFVPDGETHAINITEFNQAISDAGFGGYRLDKLALQNATAKYNSGDPFEITVGEALDGQFFILVDDNQTAAYLTCTLPLGGAPVKMESILQEAEHKGITVKLNLEAIQNALLKGGDNVLIASGKAPVDGVDGRIESLVPSMSNRSPHLDKDGLADFRELGEIVTVHIGDVLMRHIPATSGEPGMTVLGKVIPPKPGKDVPFATKLNGAILDPKNPDELIALIDGYPVQEKNEVSVEPVYQIKDVDLHTGNITFGGTVHVTGDVQTNMTVKATGDIHVDGTVEGAILDAGGDIVVKGGILGLSEKTEKFYSVVKCGGSCTARFAQNANILAGNGIFIRDFSMQSELTAGHQIIVGDKGSRKGILIGGIARASMLVKAYVIGSDTYAKTIIIAGADQLLQERMNAAVKAREWAENKLSDILKLLALAHQNPGRIPLATVNAAEATRAAINAEIVTLKEDVKELQREIDLVNGAQVLVEKKIFAGAEVRFGLKRNSIVADRQGGVFHLKDGELVFD